jgi:hypothetical protein
MADNGNAGTEFKKLDNSAPDEDFVSPMGWVSHVDPASGNVYFAHSLTGEVRWTDPTLELGEGNASNDDAGDVEMSTRGKTRSKQKKKKVEQRLSGVHQKEHPSGR